MIRRIAIVAGALHRDNDDDDDENGNEDDAMNVNSFTGAGGSSPRSRTEFVCEFSVG